MRLSFLVIEVLYSFYTLGFQCIASGPGVLDAKSGHSHPRGRLIASWLASQVAALVVGAGGEVDSEKPYAELW